MAIPNLYAIRDWCLNRFARKKDIPTKTSDLDNDSGFVTSQYPVEILDEEQTEANTTPDKYVSDAMVTKELLLRQNGVQWIVDEETGAIKSYKTKVGADTEFPFSGFFKVVSSFKANNNIVFSDLTINKKYILYIASGFNTINTGSITSHSGCDLGQTFYDSGEIPVGNVEHRSIILELTTTTDRITIGVNTANGICIGVLAEC